MWTRLCVVFVAVAIGGMMLSTVSVDAHSTDDSVITSCESSDVDETETLIRLDLKDVKLIRKDLKAVKSLLGSGELQNSNASSTLKYDLENVKNLLEDVKNLLGSNQQQSSNVSCIFKQELTELKAACAVNLQHNSESCISRRDLEEVKNLIGSTQQRNSNVSCISQQEMRDLKAACASNQPQINNASCVSKADLADLKAVCASNHQHCPLCPPTVSTGSNITLASTLIASCVPILIQQKVNGSGFFNRSWAEFKVGFNDSRGNYWLGNDLISQLTLRRRYKLRFDLLGTNMNWYYAEYSSFFVLGESHNYGLHVYGYSGNAGDALSYHNGLMFTTHDRDNDPWTSRSSQNNCARGVGGGFWYKDCCYCCINGISRGSYFKWYSRSKGRRVLQLSRMWLMC